MTEARQDGAAIRQRRKELGIGPGAFAGQVGIHRDSLTNIELDRKSARLDTLLSIASALGVDLIEIVRPGTSLHEALTRESDGDGGRAA